MQQDGSKRRHFTEAARIAAAIARKQKALTKEPTGQPTVFAVRLGGTTVGFGWEIRRYGGLVLAKSPTGHPTQAHALDAGREALLAHSLDALRRRDIPGTHEALASL